MPATITSLEEKGKGYRRATEPGKLASSITPQLVTSLLALRAYYKSELENSENLF